RRRLIFYTLGGLLLVSLVWRGHHSRRFSVHLPEYTPDAEVLQISTGTIGMGGSLGKSLDAVGVDAPKSNQIQRTLASVFNPRFARPSDKYELFLSSAGDFVRLRYWPNAFAYYEVVRSTTGDLSAEKIQVPLNDKIVGVSGQIQVSLWDAMTQQGVP